MALPSLQNAEILNNKMYIVLWAYKTVSNFLVLNYQSHNLLLLLILS